MPTPPARPPSQPPPAPLPHILITADDVRGDPEHFASLLNQIILNQNQMINQLLGFSGPIPLNSHLDLQGNRVTNVAPPQAPSDAVSSAHAEQTYSAPVLRPQLEADGPHPLTTYRILGHRYQRETSSSHLNALGNIAPYGNNSQISFGAPTATHVPCTITAGQCLFADGTVLRYPAYNDSCALPASYAITFIERVSGLVTANVADTTGLEAGESVLIAGVGDASFNGYFVLSGIGVGGSPPGPMCQYAQAGADASSSGGTLSLFGVYYYVLRPATGKLSRVGPYSADTQYNRVQAMKDGMCLIGVAVINSAGGDTLNSAAGATPPLANIGGGNRVLRY